MQWCSCVSSLAPEAMGEVVCQVARNANDPVANIFRGAKPLRLDPELRA